MQTPNGGGYDALFKAVRALFSTYYAGIEPDSLTITAHSTANGQRIDIQLPLPTGPLKRRPTEDEQAIIDAIGTDRLNAQKIARLTGHKYNGHLRDKLANMVEEGFLRKVPGAYEVQN